MVKAHSEWTTRVPCWGSFCGRSWRELGALGVRGGQGSPAIQPRHTGLGGLPKIKPGSCLIKATNSKSGTENRQRPRKEGSFRGSVSYLPPDICNNPQKTQANIVSSLRC